MIASLLRPAMLAACLGACLGACLSGPALAASPSQFFTYDPADLALARQKVAARDPLYLPSYDKLLSEAGAALAHRRYSVADKSLTPASGDRHDFFSFGPYWWPDPSKKDGLPYIRKDGLHNPASSLDATDAARMGKFSHDVKVLALAWYFTGEQKYAAKAGELARAWFLAPGTRMNPNLDYGQAIPGRVNGRGIGIITSRNLIDVMDSLALIQPAAALTDAENDGVRAWYRDYLHWLLTSRNGFEESNAHNNHGTWYSAQVVAYALYTNQPEIAGRELEITKIRRIPGQIDREGKLVAELERTRPSGYINFALEAFGNLGRYGELAGENLWAHGQDAHNMEQGYRYVARFVDGDKWPYKEIDPKEGSADGVNQHAMHNMLAAARAYRDEPVFAEKARWLLQHYPGQLDALILPLAAPAQAGTGTGAGAAFTPGEALGSLFEVEGNSPFPSPYAGTLNFSALGSRFATANGHGYRNELKIARKNRLPIEQTREHFSATVTPTLPNGARTIVAQYHVEGLETIVKVYVQDTEDGQLLDGKSGNGVFDVVAKMSDSSGKDAATALGTVRSGESFGLDIRFEHGDATVAVKTARHGSLQTARTRIKGDKRNIYFKFGDYLQAVDPDTKELTSSPARWDEYFRRNGIDGSRISFSRMIFVRD